MPIMKKNQRTFFRSLYCGETQTVILLKRNNDQGEGTVRAITLFDCRRERTSKTGQPIQNEMSVAEFTTWQIPSFELDRNGVNYINVLDRIVDQHNRYWQPESGQSIDVRLFEDWVFINCVRIDPPSPPAIPASTGI